MIEVSVRVNGREVALGERQRRMVLLVLAAQQQANEFESGVLELHFRGKARHSVKGRLLPVIHVGVESDDDHASVAVDRRRS